MRILSFIIAFAVFLIGPSLAGMPDGNLPGIGTFSYYGSPIVTDAVIDRDVPVNLNLPTS